jgi:hypothetical protein
MKPIGHGAITARDLTLQYWSTEPGTSHFLKNAVASCYNGVVNSRQTDRQAYIRGVFGNQRLVG